MKTVTVMVRWRGAVLQAPARAHVFDLLASHLSYQENRFEVGGPVGHRHKQLPGYLLKRLARNRYWIPAFVVDRVTADLGRRGYDVRVQETTSQWWGSNRAVNWRVAHEVAPAERPLLTALSGCHSGLLEAASPGQVARAIELLVRLHPQARIVIAAGRKSEVRALHKELLPRLGDRVATVKGWKWNSTNRVIVSSYLVPDVANLADWDIFVFADALQVAVPSHCTDLVRMCEKRVFGFVKPDWRPGPLVRLRLLSFLGPVVYRSSDGQGPGPGVRVLCFHPPWSDPLADGLTPLERKRRSYWHNDARNDAIAAVARAFRAADEQTLWSHGLLLGPKPAELQREAPAAITILVESPSHARELLTRLPGWGTEASGVAETIVQPALGGGWSNPPGGVVMTTLAAARRSPLLTDVLIRAEGGAWPLSVPAIVPRTGAEALLIDLLDDSDATVSKATQARLADYSARGWVVRRPETARANN